MLQPATARSVQPHPPSGIPRYFDTSPFEGAAVSLPGREKSRRLKLYEELSRSHFGSIPQDLEVGDLNWLDDYLLTRLEIEREERRMHFGAFALVCVLFFLVFPPMVLLNTFSLWLGVLSLLLLALIFPYALVYFGYENRVRAMALGHLRLIEARSALEQDNPSLDATDASHP